MIDLTGQFVIAHFMLHVQVCDLFNCCEVADCMFDPYNEAGVDYVFRRNPRY